MSSKSFGKIIKEYVHQLTLVNKICQVLFFYLDEEQRFILALQKSHKSYTTMYKLKSLKR